MWRTFFGWAQRYERHLSALAMVAGFVVDNLVFTRVDGTQTQLLLAGYAVACFFAIPLHHYLATRGRGKRLQILLPVITQFALGGFWSAFVIFYGRSAVFGASWPFLIFLILIFLGSEYFHRYHARLVFTSILFFFALYAWAIFAVPVVVGSIGLWVFLTSGAIAVVAFALFTVLLRVVAHERFSQDVWRIRVGVGVVLVLMHFFYVANVLPPLPLSATAAGVYHDVWHVPGQYYGSQESYAWPVRYLGVTRTLHMVRGGLVYAYSSIYAPVSLSTTITHRWQWYDSLSQTWVTKAAVAYPIQGGREGGYRGYTNMRVDTEGSWRVRVETGDGRALEVLPFTIAFVSTTPPLTRVALP
jgi:MFS family permease